MSTTINIRRLSVHLSNFASGDTSPASFGEAILASVEQTAGASAIASGDRAQFSKVLGDGTQVPGIDPRTDHVAVIDHVTGLMWSVESLGDPEDPDNGMSQERCIQRCRDLRLLGYDDWDLSSRNQTVPLIDDTRHEPAINTNLFPRVKPRLHWTKTPAAWSSASAWLVNFHYGYVYYLLRDYDGFALAVRRAGQ